MAYIVGFAGPGMVGKSTTAKKVSKILKERGIKSTNYAFATPIYKTCEILTGIPISKLKNKNYKELTWTKESAPLKCLIGWTPRKLLQKIGTECIRDNIHGDFWIESAINAVKKYDIALIEDARFVNEFKHCDLIIELERDGVVYLKNHVSAMPPDKKYVDKKIKLHKNIDYNTIADYIISCYNKDI